MARTALNTLQDQIEAVRREAFAAGYAAAMQAVRELAGKPAPGVAGRAETPRRGRRPGRRPAAATPASAQRSGTYRSGPAGGTGRRCAGGARAPAAPSGRSAAPTRKWSRRYCRQRAPRPTPGRDPHNHPARQGGGDRLHLDPARAGTAGTAPHRRAGRRQQDLAPPRRRLRGLNPTPLPEGGAFFDRLRPGAASLQIGSSFPRKRESRAKRLVGCPGPPLSRGDDDGSSK